MTKLKLASLLVAFVLWSAGLIDLSFRAGFNTSHNVSLWRVISSGEQVGPVPMSERSAVYQTYKRGFAFNTEGDGK